MKVNFKKGIKKLALVSCLISSGCSVVNANVVETLLYGSGGVVGGALLETATKVVEKCIDTYHLKRQTRPKDVTKENEAKWETLQKAYNEKANKYDAYIKARAEWNQVARVGWF